MPKIRTKLPLWFVEAGSLGTAWPGSAATRRDVAAHETEKQGHPDMLLSKLRDFVRLLKSR